MTVTANQQRTHFRTFLDLPPAVRLSVYKQAGLWLDTSISLAPTAHFEDEGEGKTDDDDERNQQTSPGLALSLLQSCKAVHDEVIALVLSRNTLIVEPASLTYALRFLHRLTPRHCANITSLHVDLQRDTTLRVGSQSSEEETWPLTAEQAAAWEQAALHLLAHAKPKALSVRLICDQEAAGGDYSHVITGPFFKYPGKLASLKLRLSATRNSHLSDLALRTAASATGDHSHPALRKGVFRFLELPEEMRLHILEYTDLVTPSRHVGWDSQHGYRCEDPDFPLHSLRCTRTRIRGCRFRFEDLRDRFSEPEFCPLRFSAYNSISVCRCFAPPLPLMLVSRALYHEAQAVFFTNNRIAVGPPGDYRVGHDPPLRTWRVDPAKFLTRPIFPDVLHHLKTLQLVFQDYDLLLCHDPGSMASLDWAFAARHLLANANVENLTLAIYLCIINTSPMQNHPDEEKLYQKYRSSGCNNTQRLAKAYKSILSPLKPLGHLKRLFVYARTPTVKWCRCFERRVPCRADERWMYEAYLDGCQMGARLEKLVMGSDYDSRALGKVEFESPGWGGCFALS